MGAILRSLGAVVLGVLAAAVLVLVMEAVGHTVFPPPPGLDLGDSEQRETFMAQLPLGALVFVLAGWSLGTLAGSWLAAALAGQAPAAHGLVVGVLFLAMAVATMLVIPHPLWFWVVALLLFPLSSGIGVLLSPAKKRLA
jgi:hypothetical protein